MEKLLASVNTKETHEQVFMWVSIILAIVAFLTASLAVHNIVRYIWEKNKFELWLFYVLLLIECGLLLYSAIDFAISPSKFPEALCSVAGRLTFTKIVEIILYMTWTSIFLTYIATLDELSCSLDLIDPGKEIM